MAVRSLVLVVTLCLCGAPVRGQTAAAPPDTFVAAPDALALMQTLNAELLASRSATQTLQQWCGDHHLAAEARITARLIRGVTTPPSAEQRQHLQVTAKDEVRHRRVQLQCGGRVLSEADNWYVPARLTPEMNRQLETTDIPFGTAVRPLQPSRETLGVTMFWSGALPMPGALFAHRAVLYTRAHVPFSEVYEVYQKEIVAR